MHHPLLERLAKRLQRAPAELRHLVQEQDPVVSQAQFPGARDGAAADQRDFRAGVVGRAEGPLDQQSRAGCERAGDGVDRGHDQCLLERQRRQEAGQAPREHGLAGARRPTEQHMVRAGRGDLNRTAACLLAPHIRQVVARLERRRRGSHRRDDGARGWRHEDAGGFGQRSHRKERQPIDDRGLGQVRVRKHEPRAGPTRGRGDRQQAAHGRNAPIEGHATDHHEIRWGAVRQHAGRREDTQRNRQVERCADLAEIGGREADRDARSGKGKSRIPNGCAHAVAALAHRRVRQADHRHAWQPAARHIDFHGNGNRFDADECGRGDSREHAAAREQGPRHARTQCTRGPSRSGIADSAMRPMQARARG